MATSYIVQSGDTLSKIAKVQGTTVDAIAKANNISNVNLIKVGQKLSFGGSPAPTYGPVKPLSINLKSAVTSTKTSTSMYDTRTYRDTLSRLTSPQAPQTNKYGTNLSYSMPKAPVGPTQYAGIKPSISSTLKGVPPTYAPPRATPTGGGSYVVVAGDSLTKIASRNGMTVQQLQQLNPDITNPNMIRVGQAIKLGGGQAPAGPTYGPVQSESHTPQGPVSQGAPAYQQNTPSGQYGQPNQGAGDSNDLARKAGEAGLSVQEYQNLMDGQNSVSKEETDRIAKELGITALEGEVFKKPKESTQKVFDSAYKSAGLSDIKGKIQKITDDIDKDRADLTEAIGAIDENPFLTETSRVGRGKRVLDQAESIINNKLAQAKTLQDLYDAGIGEITKMIERDASDFGRDQLIDQAKLNYLVKKAEIEANQLQDTRANDPTATATYLSSRAGSGGTAPEVVGNADTGYYTYDQTTKKFVQVISAADKTTAETFKPTAEQQGLVGRYLSTAEAKAAGATSSDLKKAMEDPAFFYYILQLASDAGIY